MNQWAFIKGLPRVVTGQSWIKEADESCPREAYPLVRRQAAGMDTATEAVLIPAKETSDGAAVTHSRPRLVALGDSRAQAGAREVAGDPPGAQTGRAVRGCGGERVAGEALWDSLVAGGLPDPPPCPVPRR